MEKRGFPGSRRSWGLSNCKGGAQAEEKVEEEVEEEVEEKVEEEERDRQRVRRRRVLGIPREICAPGTLTSERQRAGASTLLSCCTAPRSSAPVEG